MCVCCLQGSLARREGGGLFFGWELLEGHVSFPTDVRLAVGPVGEYSAGGVWVVASDGVEGGSSGAFVAGGGSVVVSAGRFFNTTGGRSVVVATGRWPAGSPLALGWAMGLAIAIAISPYKLSCLAAALKLLELGIRVFPHRCFALCPGAEYARLSASRHRIVRLFRHFCHHNLCSSHF